MNEVTPSRPLLGPVRANTRPQSDWPTPEIQILVPLRAWRSRRFSAGVLIARPGSGPPLASEIATKVLPPAAMVGTAYFSICSLLPRKIELGGSQPNA